MRKPLTTPVAVPDKQHLLHGASVDELRRELKKSVDAYLNFCAKHSKDPEKSLSGKLVVRVKPELHRAIAIAASTNALITEKLADDFGVIA